jgi:hypothetical protein
VCSRFNIKNSTWSNRSQTAASIGNNACAVQGTLFLAIDGGTG